MSEPNLLFLYSDEQRYDTMACYGNQKIDMPHLNRLAASSTVVEQAYVTQPVCTPSRSTLLTGLWPHSNGCVENNIPLRPETPCLPEMLQDGVYHCAHHGKWHLGDEVFAQHGFDEWISTEDGYHNWYGPDRDQRALSNFDSFLRAHGCRPKDVTLPDPVPAFVADRFFREQIHALPEALCRPTFLANSASRYIRDHQDGTPWALYVNFLEPHMPFYSCRDKQYDPGEVTLPDNWGMDPASDHSLRARLYALEKRFKGFEVDAQLDTEEQWRTLVARYWGLCSLVDTAVGRILQELEATGQMENTIIVFTSDHGDMMSSHNTIGKGFMYEESVRVPWLMKLPGQSEQRRVAGPVSQLDMVPTILDAMGQDIPESLEGQSRLSLMQEGGNSDADVYIEWLVKNKATGPAPELPDYARHVCSAEEAQASRSQDIRTIVTPDGWKYNHSSIGEHELFDLKRDPGEITNRVADQDCAEQLSQCRSKLKAWQDAAKGM